MAKKHYSWRDGPATLERHSLTKHEVLVEYLKRYFTQRTLNARGRDRFRITLVDGFCGGGEYVLRDTGQLVEGSPLRILKAVNEAQALVNLDRVKPLLLDVQYIFVDENKAAVEYLRSLLVKQGYGNQIGTSIHLVCSEFVSTSDAVLAAISRHTPKTPTALFFLDQYGYTDVPAPLVQSIFRQIRNAEIVLTFHVDSFATYTNDDLVARVSKTLRVDIQRCLQGRTIDEIKSSDADWRRFIQGALYQSLVDGCHARYFTPFFIRPEGANHGEYWLVHLSQHHRAQDVMKQVHWKHHNHFIHYGGAGLDMLAPQTMGFRQEYDGGFRFNEVAELATDTKLASDLDAHIHKRGRPQTVADLYAETCNGSPGTAEMYRKALETLIRDDRVVVFSNEGTRRTKGRLIVDTDIVEPARQVRIVF